MVADAGCLATGGAGAMGQSRPELSGGDAAAQLTTMIAAGAEVSGTSMPPTLVSTTGNETPGLAAAFPPATAVTAAVVGGDDMLSADEVSCSPLATAAVCLLSDGITCTSDRQRLTKNLPTDSLLIKGYINSLLKTSLTKFKIVTN